MVSDGLSFHHDRRWTEEEETEEEEEEEEEESTPGVPVPDDDAFAHYNSWRGHLRSVSRAFGCAVDVSSVDEATSPGLRVLLFGPS